MSIGQMLLFKGPEPWASFILASPIALMLFLFSAGMIIVPVISDTRKRKLQRSS